MALSDAGKLLHSYPGLLDGRPPEFDYRPELTLEHRWAGSANKQEGALAASAIDSLNKGLLSKADDALETNIYLGTQPFMRNESLTKEPIYRLLPALGQMMLMGAASERKNERAYEAAAKMARSHFLWALFGMVPWLGRAVTDHRIQDRRRGVVLVGDGPPKNPMPYVCQAGMRWWLRDDGSQKWLFTDGSAISGIVCSGLEDSRWPLVRKKEPNLARTIDAIQKRWPGFPLWGLTLEQREMARDFAEDPTDAALAADLVALVAVPKLSFRFVRFVDSSCGSVCLDDMESTTDKVAIDVCYRSVNPKRDGGEIRIASAADGNRREAGDVLGEEEDAAFVTWKDGRKAETLLRVPKPLGVAEAYTIMSDGHQAWVATDRTPSPPAPPFTPPPVPPNVDKPRRKGWGSGL